MTQGKTRVPAVEGWFTADDEPRLLGSRCTSCGTFVFPPATSYCRNPDCEGTEFDQVELSGRGKVWSFTANRYQPPPPYVVAHEPWEPYAIAAVELAAERMVVLGQMAPEVDIDQLHIGMEVEMVVDTLYEDDEHRYQVWKWRPVDGELAR